MQTRHHSPTAARAYKRRSPRIQLKIQLSVELGDETVVQAETLTISKHGARIRIISNRGQLSHGERLRVAKARARGQQPQSARVVWLDKRVAAHYGIELEDPGNFWGVSFPNKDSESGIQSLGIQSKDAHRPSAVPATEAMPAVLQLAVEPNAPAVPSDTERIPAMVAGISAIRLPFAERTDMVFTEPEEGTALLQNVLEPGTTLRVTLPDRVTNGRVLAVGSQREAGKWRVRIKCGGAC